MTKAVVTDGTIVRLRYQVGLWDVLAKMRYSADAGREFVAVDGIDRTERGKYLNVVLPDEYDEPCPVAHFIVLTDIEAIEVVGEMER